MLCLFVLWVVALLVGGVVGARFEKDKSGDGEPLAVFLMLACVFALFMSPVALHTQGLYDGYSTGIRDGYVTKLSRTGFIFKTWEAEMQLGTGKQAALQRPFKFSVPTHVNDYALKQLKKTMGQRVRVRYREWLCQPFTHGESGYDGVEVNVLKDPEDE